MSNKSTLDSYDIKIINILLHDGRLPVTELAKRIGISKSPCQARLKRLQMEGFIIGFRAQVDYIKLGLEQVAFVEVKMLDTHEDALEAFNNAIKLIPEVEECHLIAGSFDYLVKVRTTDVTSYRKVLGESLSRLPSVASTSTYVSMQSIKDSTSPNVLDDN
jgi:Lrp/AsnC family leucine-responsive transcriptional regulator